MSETNPKKRVSAAGRTVMATPAALRRCATQTYASLTLVLQPNEASAELSQTLVVRDSRESAN